MGRMEDALKKASEDRERVRTVEGAAPPSKASSGAPSTAGGQLAGASVGALFSDRLDERLVMVTEPLSARAEEFRRLKANLVALSPCPRILTVAAPTDGDGAHIIAANLAIALAESRNGKVLIVDGDFRRGEIARLLAVTAAHGLSELVMNSEGRAKSVPVASFVPNLDVLVAGSIGLDATRQIRPGILKEILQRIAADYAACVVVVPAIDGFADARVLAADTDGVVLVSRIGGSDRQALKRAYDALLGARARVLGTVAFGD